MLVPLDLRVPIVGRGSACDGSSPVTDDEESGVAVDVQFWSPYSAASVAVGVVDDGDFMVCRCEHVWESQLAALLILTPIAWRDE
jgi:hypothetical protein